MKTDKKTIFVVDDNRSNLVIANDALQGYYKVITFDSGARLLSVLEKLIPDLILLDVQMPEMNGYEVLEKIKSDSRFENIPVIFLTALDSAVTEVKGLSLGAVDYIIKPFAVPLLLKRIELHLSLIDYNHNLEKMVEEKIKEVVALKNSVLRITAELVESRDETTGNHIERTQLYLKILIEAMKKYNVYTKETMHYDTELIMQSSQLHDVGKIVIKDAILLKSGKLTFEEFEEMKAHTKYGEKIILRMRENTNDNIFLEYARQMTVAHHEKWDGSGYPAGLKGKDIPLIGRLMAIADVYDALVTDRPYKKAFSHEEALSIILEGKGTHFDPYLIELFEKVHEEFAKVADEMKNELVYN